MATTKTVSLRGLGATVNDAEKLFSALPSRSVIDVVAKTWICELGAKGTSGTNSIVAAPADVAIVPLFSRPFSDTKSPDCTEAGSSASFA